MKHSIRYKYRATRSGYYQKEKDAGLRQINRIRADIGLTELKPKIRKCLNCDKTFDSTHSSNRLCINCSDFTASTALRD